MPDRTQEIKNLRAVATACKNYTDKVAKDLQWQLGTYDLSVDTVNGTTSLLPSPSGTIQATMVRVDGASEVSENLIVLNDIAETTTNGVTYKVENGIVYIKGTWTGEASGVINLRYSLNHPIGSYTLSAFNSVAISTNTFLRLTYDGGNPTDINLQTANGYVSFTSTYEMRRLQLRIGTFTSDNWYVIKPMLVRGTTAPSEFKVGYTGIHNLELSGLKVEGANILNITDVAETTTNGITYKAVGGKIYAKRTSAYSSNVTINFAVDLNLTGSLNIFSNYSDNSLYYRTSETSFTSSVYQTKTNVTIDRFALIFGAEFNQTSYIELTPMFVYGSVAPTEYQPYIAPTTLPIDLTSIEDSGGNKLFADGKLREDDYITPTEQKSTRNVVDLGTINWVYDEGQSRFYFIDTTNILDAKFPVQSQTINNIKIAKDYTRVSYQNIYTAPYTDRVIAGAIINNVNYLSIRDNAYNTAEAFKTAMSGVMLEYERATPLTSNTNLSQLVKFEAHSNGSITLVNTNNQDTTSTFKYLKEVAK